MIRLATQDDAQPVSDLLATLGFAARIGDVRRRLELLETDHDWIFVSERAGAGIVGLIGVHAMRMLHTDGLLARITILVVAGGARRSGVGRELIGAARTFARQTGCTRIEITSADAPAGDIGFYTKVGFHADEHCFAMNLAH